MVTPKYCVCAFPFFPCFFLQKSPNLWPSEDMVVPATRLEWRHWSSQPLCTLRCRESPLGLGLGLASGYLEDRIIPGLGGPRGTFTPPREDENGLEAENTGGDPLGKGKESEAKHHDFRFYVNLPGCNNHG